MQIDFQNRPYKISLVKTEAFFFAVAGVSCPEGNWHASSDEGVI